jgi:ribosome modulation factor
MIVRMKQALHLAGWRYAMIVRMKQALHLAGWRYAMIVSGRSDAGEGALALST